MTVPETAHGLSIPQHGARALLWRVIDIVCASTALIVLAPIMLGVTIAILLEGGRPILFSQLRLGQNGWPFRMYKFRKFAPDCRPDGSPVTVDKDERLTPVGRVLLASKLDELPQLWNVLRGDMSVVGPRPESLDFSDCFRNGFEDVLKHKPGLFGPSQIMFRHETKLYPADVVPADFYRQALFPAKAKIDLAYFSRRTLLSDFGWIFRGVWAVVAGAPNHPDLKSRSHDLGQ